MRDLRGVDLNLLVALDVLLDERSVRSAARRMHMTPSAMSHTLRRIRELFEDDVLVRAGRGMVATPRAMALAEPVRALLAQTRAVLADPDQFSPATLRRAFRVACTDHVSTVLLPSVERILSEEAPGVNTYVCPFLPDMTDELRTGTVCLAIGVFRSEPAEMRVRRLFEERFVTVARPDHPRIRGPELTLEAFLEEQHVQVAPGGSPEGPIDALLATRGLHRRVARTRPNFLSALWLVADSNLLLTTPRRVVSATATRLPMSLLPTPLPVTEYHLSMVWHPRLDDVQEDLWFREVVLRAARAL